MEDYMVKAITESKDIIAVACVTTNLVNGLVGGLSSVLGSAAPSRPIILQVLLDRKTIAQTIFDPLKDVSVQRGVSLG